jgi:F-type H+-transporting ATPase subunit c
MTAKVLKVVVTVSIVLAVTAIPAFAAESDAAAPETASALNLNPLIALGAGLVTLGGAFGIGKLAASAMEGTARQPEAGGAIRTSMIIAAALIEGFTFFALIVCMISKVA